jgi:peptide/nickel transport system permease protein
MTILLFLLRRISAMAVLLVIVSFAVFGLVSLTPGGPEQTLAGPGAGSLDPASIAAIRKMYNLDQSFFPRYLHWLQSAVHLDFGHSVPDREPVMQMIAQRLPITLELGAMTLIMVVLIGIPAGMLAARRRGGPVDRAVSLASIFAASAPGFAVAIILIYVFGVGLGWLPVFGVGDGFFDRIQHLILPSIALATAQLALLVRQTRAATLDVLNKDFLTFARARGLSPGRIVLAYQLRNAALPVITTIGLLIIASLSGAVLIEAAFALPGVGSLMVQSVTTENAPVVQGIAMLTAGMVVVVNLIVDVLALAINPRTRLLGARG